MSDPKTEKVDPDLATLANLLITSVGVVAHIYFGLTANSNRRLPASHGQDHLRHIRDELEELIREIERIMRLIVKEAGQEKALEAKLSFGNAPIYLESNHMDSYKRYFSQISQKMSATNMWILTSLQIGTLTPEIALAVQHKMGDAHTRLNRMWQMNVPISEVFEECLLMLRAAYSALSELDRVGN